MKKIMSFFFIFAIFINFVCAEIIDLSKMTDTMVLQYNKWGTEGLSRWQSMEEDITMLFNGKLPQKGDMLNITWKGTSDIDIKNLFMLIVDIDEENNWTHLLSDSKMKIPVVQNIKSGQEFTINAIKTLDFSPKTNVKIFFCCGEKDINKNAFLITSTPEGFERVEKSYNVLGVKFGSNKSQTKISENIIIWEKGFDNGNAGWNFSGIDLSAYERVRVEVESTDAPISLRIAQSDWSNNHGFGKTGKNVYEAYLSGSNSFDGDLPPLDPSKGLYIYLNQWNSEPRTEDKTTVVKSIKFFKPGEYDESGALSIYGHSFGAIEENCEIQDNTIIWKKGTKEAYAGWNLSYIDLSEYVSVKITFEKTDVNLSGLFVTDPYGGNWKRMIEVAPNTYELLLTGENSDSTEPPIDTSEGVQLRIQLCNNKPLKKNMKTIVKSIELSKDTEEINENLRIEGVEFSSSKRNAFVSDGGVIDWEWDKKEKYPFCGWNVKGIDLSDYKGIRIELESTDIPVEIGMIQNEGGVCHTFYNEKTPGVYEAMFDGSEYSSIWPEGSSWNTSNGIEEIQIRAQKLSKKGLKTVVKSISLISKDEQEIQQPAQLVLNGAKLGSKKNHAWIGDDFSINWKKNSWNECGWKVEKLDGEILEIKILSSDVPLRLRIRTLDHKNGVSYIDDGSHIFKINLKTKKQINQKGGQKAPEWEETTKKVDYSQGCYITLEAKDGVYKEGKKTVVEYIKVE